MSIRILFISLILSAVFASVAIALPPGRTIEMKSTPMYKVIFSGNTHMEKGVQCDECHPDIFKMKIGSTNIPAPHKPGEFCGRCHDGKRAFNQADNCGRCHELKKAEK